MKVETEPGEAPMFSTSVATAIEMLKALPESAQEQAVEHLRDYIAELVDEGDWAAMFEATQPQLVAAARRAKEQIARGEAAPLDLEKL